jgi:hypothetical protein
LVILQNKKPQSIFQVNIL